VSAEWRESAAKQGPVSQNSRSVTVGFSSVSHFIGYYQKETGLTPKEYQRKYGNNP